MDDIDIEREALIDFRILLYDEEGKQARIAYRKTMEEAFIVKSEWENLGKIPSLF
jgi:hypothetical protein